MATRIKPKRGTGAPTTSDLETNEIAMDVAAKKLYVHDGTNIVVLAENISNNDINQLSDADELLKTAEGLSKVGDITIENTGGLNYKFYSNVGGGFAHYNTATELRVLANSNTTLLNSTSLRTIGQNPFYDWKLFDTGTGDDGSHDLEITTFGGSVRHTYFDNPTDENPVEVNAEASTFNFKPTTEFNVIVDGDNVLEADNTTITVSKPISSTQNITGQDITANGDFSTTNEITADVGANLGWSKHGDPTGSGTYFGMGGVMNANYVNVTSPTTFNSTMQLYHPLNTDDDIHSMIRMKSDMEDQTPYDHKFGIFAQSTSVDRGDESIGEFFFHYKEDGNMAFDLSIENFEYGNDNIVTTMIFADTQQYAVNVPIRLQHIDVGSTLPSSPSVGDRFIHNGDMKIYADGTWNIKNPENGAMVYDITNNRTLIRENNAFRAITTTAI